MGFTLGLFIAFLIFFFGSRFFERRNIPAPLDSLRMGRLHHLLLGIFIGLFLPSDNALVHLFEELRYSLAGIALVWFGFQAGLNFDLQRFRTHPPRQLLSETIQAAGTFLLVFLGVIAIKPLLHTYLGVEKDIALVALLLGAFATTLRTPILHRRKKTSSPPICANPVGLILFGLLFPLVGENTVLRLGPLTVVGYANTLAILAVPGLLLGITLDFIFHAHKASLRCIYLSVGMIAAIGGLCLPLQTPGIFVGFIGGGWLINTTVRRREVLELTERAGAVAEPIFFMLLGSIVVGGEAAFFRPDPLVLFTVGLFLMRGLIRMLGVVAAWHISDRNRTWQNLIDVGWCPLGTLSAALIVQGLYLPLRLTHNTLIAGALFSVFLSQLFFTSPSRKNVAPPSQPDSLQA